MGRSPGCRPAGARTRQLAGAEGSPRPSILILYSDTGGGHRAAAKAIEQGLRQLEPDARVSHLDPLIGHGPALVARLARQYPRIIQRSGAAWGALYHASNTGPAFAAIRAVFGRSVRRVLLAAMQGQDPDVVVSVHPLLNHVAFRALQASGRRRGLMTVVTDLVEFHRAWAFSKVDLLVVPTEGARQAVLRRRVPADRVKLLGLPLDLRFRPPAPGEREALRRRFGLAEDRLTVLVAGGGEGSGRLLQQVRALAWREHPWQVIAVCGRNDKLRRRLARLHFGSPTLVLGFVDNMPELMRASDLAVGKAGPGQIAEALATGLPLILTSYLPGQETANVRFVTDGGLGLYESKPDQLPAVVERLLAPPLEPGSSAVAPIPANASAGAVLARMAARAAEIARPYASLDIARECLQLANRYRGDTSGGLGAGAQRAASQTSR